MAALPLATSIADLDAQAQRFDNARQALDSYPKPVHEDLRGLMTHAHGWVVLRYANGAVRCVPTLFAGYIMTVEEFSRERRASLDSTAAVRAVTR